MSMTVKDILVERLGQMVAVHRASVFENKSTWAAARSLHLGWSVYRMPDGTEVVSGLDREVACHVADQMSALETASLLDFKGVLRHHLGRFVL